MIESLTDRLVSFLVLKNIIDTEKFEKYRDKIKSLIFFGMSFVSVILVGTIFGKVTQGIILLICYLIIRRFACGYRAKNYIIRLLMFMGIYIFTIFSSSYEDLTTYKFLIVLFTVLSWGCIYALAPVDNIKDKMDFKDILKNKIISRTMATIITFLTIILLKIEIINEYAAFTCSALYWSAFMLVLGTIKNYINN
ncbi:hypothetical protein VN21_14620 [Paraclostridium benzoelyticum]|uniref:Accessory gene regulator AgrB n=2 Tax=Paraclostridium benzoelyticum TaxID=1629550 RepID=A0A0M3DFZ8_9FIRM|nr:accessory gene regulator B family protein [Paraclostridium benzoelyticum]KKY00317.1 hypothetical protein VN21_14620 [Paraclostridium benzoelyticum]